MAEKKTTEESVDPTPSPAVDMTSKLGNPTLEQVRAERERVEEASRHRPADDDTGEIPPPNTSSYVVIPNGVRDDDADHEGHEVQVAQVFTYDDGSLPRVSLRCSCAREYNVDWTQELAMEVVRAGQAELERREKESNT